MLFILILGACLGVWGYFAYRIWTDGFNSLLEKIGLSVVGFVIGGLCFVGLELIVFGFVGMFTHDVTHDRHWDLQQISTAQSVHGRFFLGTGYVDGQQSFVAYYKDSGGFRLGTFGAQDTVVIERDNVSPVLVEHDHYEPSWVMPISWQDKFDLGSWDWTIYVPSGSIASNIDLNLK